MRLVLVLFGFGLLAVPDVQAVSFTIDGSWSGVEGPGAGTVRSGGEQSGLGFTPTVETIVGTPASGERNASCSNSGEAPCPDVISFPAAGAAEVAGTPYSFTLLGFGDRMNGPLVDHFVTQAGHDGHTSLWGVFTEAPPSDASSLPEPSSLLLLGAGLGFLKLRRPSGPGVAAVRRRLQEWRGTTRSRRSSASSSS
jgi:hypothetical protein